jgi:L-ascorbate metabolism protein UlaG (beta-lactamase superfamily)
VLRGRVAHLVRVAPPPTLEHADVILVSHAHYDHLDLRSLRRLPREARVVVPFGLGRTIRRFGFAVDEVEEGDVVELGPLRVQVTHAEHAPGRGLVARGVLPVGYVVDGSLTVYFAGDTDVFPGMASIAPALDVALLPVSGWGPRVPEGHLDPARAAASLRLLQPRVCIPIHWGTFRPFHRGRPYDVDAGAGERFRALAHDVAPLVEVRVLAPGERTIIQSG